MQACVVARATTACLGQHAVRSRLNAARFRKPALCTTVPSGLCPSISVRSHACNYSVVKSNREFIIRNAKSSEEAPLQDEEDAAVSGDDTPAPAWSLASYDDVIEHFNHNVLEESIVPETPLSKIMQTNVRICNPETPLTHIEPILSSGAISGLPVVMSGDGTLVGVVSKKDLFKSGSSVQDVMTTPPVATHQQTTVQEAACIMLKYKIHRLPVVDRQRHCIGIVTRSDIFDALGMKAVDLGAGNATLCSPVKKTIRIV